MPAAFDDATVVEHQDAVGADHAGQPVRQDQRRAPGRQPVERLLDHRLVLGVDRGQRLVEDQDRRIAQQRPCDRQPLALAARQQHPALADHRGIALRQRHDEVVRVGGARRGLDFFPVGIGLAEPQILLDRAVKQIGVLVHDGDHAAQRLGVERLQIVAADPHGAALRVEEPQQQARDRGFAGAARADDADLLAGGDGEGEPVMGRAAPAGIGEIDVLERDGREQRQLGGRVPPAAAAPSGSAANSALMPAAADCPSMPWCSTMRRSRKGRNTSVPAISTISSACRLINPCDTRQAPSDNAAAAPIATPQSVMPRVITPIEMHPHRAVAQLARPVGEPAAIGRTLAKGLQGRQPLDAVEKLRAEGF